MLSAHPQQISRWRADGLLKFDADGMCDAFASLLAIVKWSGHGRTPAISGKWRARVKASKSPDDFWRGVRAGMDAAGRLCEHYKALCVIKTPPGLEKYYNAPPLTDAELDKLYTLPPIDTDALRKEMEEASAAMEKTLAELQRQATDSTALRLPGRLGGLGVRDARGEMRQAVRQRGDGPGRGRGRESRPHGFHAGG